MYCVDGCFSHCCILVVFTFIDCCLKAVWLALWDIKASLYSTPEQNVRNFMEEQPPAVSPPQLHKYKQSSGCCACILLYMRAEQYCNSERSKIRCRGWKIITCFIPWQHQLSSAPPRWPLVGLSGQSEIEKSIRRRLSWMHLQAAVMTADSFLQLLVQSHSNPFSVELWAKEQYYSVESVQLNALSASPGSAWDSYNVICYDACGLFFFPHFSFFCRQ